MGNVSIPSNKQIEVIEQQREFVKTINNSIYGQCDLYRYGPHMIVAKRKVS
jgi:hypothetical protein